MPKSLVRKFMREGLTEKQAETKAIRIERAREKKTMSGHTKPLPPKQTNKRKKKKGSKHKSSHKK